MIYGMIFLCRIDKNSLSNFVVQSHSVFRKSERNTEYKMETPFLDTLKGIAKTRHRNYALFRLSDSLCFTFKLTQ